MRGPVPEAPDTDGVANRTGKEPTERQAALKKESSHRAAATGFQAGSFLLREF